MEIQYLGHSCFRIKGKNAVVVIDPFNPSDLGLKLTKVTADVILISHDHFDHNYISGIEGTDRRREPFLVNGPGEYEASGVAIAGIPTFHDETDGSQRGKNTVYVIHMDDLRVVFLGDLGHKLSDKQLEEINGTDILMVPVGGVVTLDAKQASEVIVQIDPKIVIPMHYKLPGLALDLAPLDEFLNLMGKEGTLPLPKLTISKDKLPEETTVVLLERK
jgi:L-ascorbate metabolism protein UlaG (beta-lactamase superfamily)